jgi:hypothetical protein
MGNRAEREFCCSLLDPENRELFALLHSFNFAVFGYKGSGETLGGGASKGIRKGHFVDGFEAGCFTIHGIANGVNHLYREFVYMAHDFISRFHSSAFLDEREKGKIWPTRMSNERFGSVRYAGSLLLICLATVKAN